MPKNKVKAYLGWAGLVLSLLAITFVFIKLNRYSDEINFSITRQHTLLFIGLVLVYGAGNFILTLSWQKILQHLELDITFQMATRIFGKSQLAKYVPGNIFHFVGRQVHGHVENLPAWPLAKSAAWEVGVLVVAGTFFVFLLIPAYLPDFSLTLILFLFSAVVLFSAFIFREWFSPSLSYALMLNTIFLLISSLIFCAVLFLTVSKGIFEAEDIVTFSGAYVIAWLAGFVSPGAPAGVGIREFVLYSILRTKLTESDLLSAILLARMVTVCGDLVFYLFAQSLTRADPKNS